MAPIKFEEHIKDRLDERTIKPSNNSWNKISNELGNSSATKKRGTIWYAVAASVIGVLIASVFYFSYQDETVLKENQVVGGEAEKEALEEEKTIPKIIFEDVALKENDWVEMNTAIENNEKPELKSVVVASIKLNDDKEIVTAVGKEVKADEFEETNFIGTDALINFKINELVAQVDSLELNNTTVTDAEIDALLRKAQNEILEQKIFRNSTTVDAMALLSEAEEELDLSLRDQLFETLKNGYLKVRTAVADRNN
tara:strand:- start:14332 stop:15096 length:765 start_codon:yes stop_codon:yes gene_type:complete